MADVIKDALAQLVHEALDERGYLFWSKINRADMNVEVRRVDNLTTQLRVLPRVGSGPRYFTVKLTEHI